MTGLISDPIGNAALEAQGSDAYASTPFEGADWFGLSQQLLRAGGNAAARLGAFDEYGRQLAPPEPPIGADIANRKYGIPGALTFDAPLPDSVAQSMNEAKHDELLRENAAARAPAGFASGAARLGAGFVAGALDPVNIASVFLPSIGEARAAAMLGRLGMGGLAPDVLAGVAEGGAAAIPSVASRMAVRGLAGAAAGATGQIPLVGLHYALSRQEQADYSASDAMADIVMGTLLGGGLHTAVGGAADLVGRAFERSPAAAAVEADPDLRESLVRASVAQMAEGRPVDVRPVLDAAPPRTAAAALPGGIEAFDPADVQVDATRFQFKAGGDERGATDRLEGVRQWDPRLAGTALVWRDENGVNWIADGHQRLALAQRLAAEGQAGIKLNAFVLNAADGVTDADARAIAAAKNIAEGSGTPIDAAKIIRQAAAQGTELPPLPPRSVLVRDGQALARLSPDAFHMVVNDLVPTNQAAIVGRLVSDPLDQTEAMRLLAKTAPDNVRQAEMIVREMLASGTQLTRQDSLFGPKAFAASVVLERAKIADQAMQLLGRDRATFRVLVNRANTIAGTGGNVLDSAANTARLTTDEQATQLLTQLATRVGPVSAALTDLARRAKSGELSYAAAAREFLGTVRTAIESGVDQGGDAGGAVAGDAGHVAGVRPEGTDAAGVAPDAQRLGDRVAGQLTRDPEPEQSLFARQADEAAKAPPMKPGDAPVQQLTELEGAVQRARAAGELGPEVEAELRAADEDQANAQALGKALQQAGDCLLGGL